jgi:hypothetical protein
MTGPMSGKVVIITGASSGVGEAAARGQRAVYWLRHLHLLLPYLLLF